MDEIPVVRVGRTFARRGGLAALALLALTALGLVVAPRAGLSGYLVAFTFWASIAFGALALLMVFHASRARWPVVLRRPLEALALGFGPLLLLFVPIALGLAQLYPWVRPAPDLSHEAAELLAHKRPYLSVPGFLVRSLVYLVTALLVARAFFRWSTALDASGDLRLLQRQRWLGSGGLPLLGLVMTFAAFDWIMSLAPLWFSTIFGIYYIAGSMVGAVAALVLFLLWGPAELRRLVTAEHLHNLGKFLLAFTCFWGYIAFSQFLLIWIANLPEEVPFYIARMYTRWAPVSIFLIVGHFVLPFAALLSRSLKRSHRALALVAAWMLFAHLVDLYWLILPTLEPERPTVPLTLLPALAGVGAAVLAFGVWRLRGHRAAPVNDPFLPESLHYRQP